MTETFPRLLQEATGCPPFTQGVLCAFPGERHVVQGAGGGGAGDLKVTPRHPVVPWPCLWELPELPRPDREWEVGASLRSPRGPSHRQHLAEVRFRLKNGTHS